MTRNRRSAKSAGASFERLVADFLKEATGNEFIDRRVKNGRNDRGDIAGVRTLRGANVVVECKNTARLELGTWINEAELEAGNDDSQYPVIVHKRHGKGQPEDQWVTVTLDTFARLLLGGEHDYEF